MGDASKLYQVVGEKEMPVCCHVFFLIVLKYLFLNVLFFLVLLLQQQQYQLQHQRDQLQQQQHQWDQQQQQQHQLQQKPWMASRGRLGLPIPETDLRSPRPWFLSSTATRRRRQMKAIEMPLLLNFVLRLICPEIKTSFKKSLASFWKSWVIPG